MTVVPPVRRALPAGPDLAYAPFRWGVAALAVAVSVLALLTGLVLAGGAPQPAVAGLPSAGPVTGWGVRVARLVADLLGLVTVGMLLVRAVLLPPGPDGRRATSAAGPWALAWAASLAVLVLLTGADVVGVPIHQLDLATLREAGGLARVRGLAGSCLAIALLGLLARRVDTVRGTRVLLAGVLLASLPAYATGHATSAPDARLAVAGITVHAVSALLWTGGLVALVWPLRGHPALAVAVTRYSALALACYVALAASGLATAVLRLGFSSPAWSSGYGALVLAKLALLTGLGLIGHRHRRRTLPRLLDGRPRDFARLAGLELCVMGVAVGLAAALASTPTPTVTSHAGMSGSPLPFATEPFTWWRLATEWRPDMVLLVAVAWVAVVAVRRTTQPVRLLGGLAVLVVATCSGLATYAPAVLGVQVAQLLLVLLVAPALLAPALQTASSTYAARAARVPPVAAAVLVSGLLLGLYRTPALEASLRSSWVSLGVLALALVAGLALAATAFDGARPAGDRLVAGLPAAASLVLLAVQLAAADRLVAVAWFISVRPDADLVADQRVAALLLGGAAVAVLLGTLQPQPHSQGQSRTTTRPSRSVSGTAP